MEIEGLIPEPYRENEEVRKPPRSKQKKGNITVEFLKGLQENLQIMLRSIKKVCGDLSGEQQVKDLDKDHEVLVEELWQETLENDWGEEEKPVPKFNCYQCREEKGRC